MTPRSRSRVLMPVKYAPMLMPRLVSPFWPGKCKSRDISITPMRAAIRNTGRALIFAVLCQVNPISRTPIAKGATMSPKLAPKAWIESA